MFSSRKFSVERHLRFKGHLATGPKVRVGRVCVPEFQNLKLQMNPDSTRSNTEAGLRPETRAALPDQID